MRGMLFFVEDGGSGTNGCVVSLGIIYIFAPCFVRAVCRSV